MNTNTRSHPFDLLFGPLTTATFPAMRARIAGKATFATVTSCPEVRELLDQLCGPDLLEGHPEAVQGYLAALHAAYRYWEDGLRTYAIHPDQIPSLLATDLTQHWIAASACYLQLPEKLFWAQIGPNEPHEPLDGIFVTPDHPRTALVGILGFRPDRLGFSQIQTLIDATDWRPEALLQRHPRFSPTMDGGAAAGFHSVVSEGELAALANLALSLLVA